MGGKLGDYHSVCGIVDPPDHSVRKAKNTFCKGIWLLCGLVATLPFLDQHRHDHWSLSGGGHSLAFLQLWRFLVMVIHHPTFYLYQAGFAQDTDAG